VTIRLNEVIPWGRSFEEYRRMFALSDADLAGRILGCGDGPASFNAEATGLGHAVVSCDPIYACSPAEIERRVEDCYADLIAQVRHHPDGFVWDQFHDPDHLGQCRLAALRRFLADFEAGKAEGRYVTAALPRLTFEDGQFDLALVSHLLFLYSERLDFEFHRAAVEELLRVAGEVRIFPLLTWGAGRLRTPGRSARTSPRGAGEPKSALSRMSSGGAATGCCGSSKHSNRDVLTPGGLASNSPSLYQFTTRRPT
jgi:hypothetical protein